MRRWCLAATISLLASSASAATVQRLTLGQLADRSEVVFIGTVAAQQSQLQRTPRQVWTETTFAVDQQIKGAKQLRFVLRQLGGTAGEGTERITAKVPGYARFEVGERVVLFLERAQTGRLVVTGLKQGKFLLTTDAKTGERVAQRELGGLVFPGAAPRTFLGLPADPNRLALGDLVAIVHGARPAPRPIPLLQTPQRRIVDANEPGVEGRAPSGQEVSR